MNLTPILLVTSGVALFTSATLSWLLILLLRPLLVRYALARPNARSSHVVPTPQGGGIAVVAATLAIAMPTSVVMGGTFALQTYLILAATALVLALLGAVDDIRPLPALPRLFVQMATVTAVILLAGPGRVLPEVVPLWLERTILIVAGVWWVNLTNFMDGIDWITVSEFVPMTAFLAVLGLLGGIGPVAAAFAVTLCGALLGFAPANRPTARLFLGDVGSLPIGLLSGWLLLSLAAAGHLAAALLLPLYYVADATLTLMRRIAHGERVWEAHRSHYYQRATVKGFSVMEVDGRILFLNLGLAALALATIAWPILSLPALLVGALKVGFVLWRFATPKDGSA